jgi:hypothetical protein
MSMAALARSRVYRAHDLMDTLTTETELVTNPLERNALRAKRKDLCVARVIG